MVALVGNPNTGKSSLFNLLTGLRRSVGNWPGTTVEVGRGTAVLPDDESIMVLDFPGAYGLEAVSPDEALTSELLTATPAPDAVLVTVDAASLSRSLYLVAQLRERDLRLVLALTKTDVAADRGLVVDPAALQRATGVPVVAVDPRRGRGAHELRHVLTQTLSSPVPQPRAVPTAGDPLALADARFAWVQAAVEAAVVETAPASLTLSDRIDRLATGRFTGPLIFLAVMWLVFQVTTVVAAPLQNALDQVIAGPVSSAVVALLEAVGVGGTWVQGFVVDGLLAGVGMLLTFLPLMALMFILLSLLEDSGYLARAAVVTDRTMRRIGLPGRAFLPLVVGFGCNVPAISATRVLSDSRQRLLTALLVPFTSCSARLPVYVIVGAAFFGSSGGTVVFAMYLMSILLVVGVGLLLRGTLIRRMGNDPLVIDLPPYHVPGARVVASVTWLRLQGFLRTASGIIVATVTVVWLLSSIPVGGDGRFAEVPVEESAYAAVAQAVTPVFEPAGFANWQATGALMAGFVAKEAVISSWAQTYAMSEPGDLNDPGSLGDAVRADFAASSGGHAQAAAMAFLIFLLAYTPCVATMAAQRREIGARWTAFAVGMQIGVAWLLAVVAFQVLRLLW